MYIFMDIGICKRYTGQTETNDRIEGLRILKENAMKTATETQEDENIGNGDAGKYGDFRQV